MNTSEFLMIAASVVPDRVALTCEGERRTFAQLQERVNRLANALQALGIGAGIELALCCDIRIAADDARLGLPEVGLGYIPSAGGTQTLPRHVPPGIAMRMVLTGDPIDAAAALRHGLVQRVAPRDRLYDEAESLARTLASRGLLALRLARRAVVEGLEMPLVEGLALEHRLARRALATTRR